MSEAFVPRNAIQDFYDKLKQKDDRPNILILMTDQQRYDTIKSLGNDHMVTPNLDRLVSEGCAFERAYTPNPICCPARHNFITGVGAKYHGIADNDFNARLDPAIPTFPELLGNAGYQTIAIGKMHHQPARAHHGFERLLLMEEVPNYREDDDYALFLKEEGYGHVQNIHGVRNLLYMLPQRTLLPDNLHGSKWIADEGIKVIKANNGNRPFCMFMSWIAPHPPFNVPEEFVDTYKNVDIPMPAKSVTDTNVLAKENSMLGDLPNDEYIRRMRESYYSMITHVDQQIGRTLDALEEIGELDNTLIIFTTDHGEMLGDNGSFQKWVPYDSCSKIPFIVRYPKKLEKGSRYKEFVDLNDIFPTLLDVAKVDFDPPFPLMGESLFTKNKVKDREYQYVAYAKESRRWASIVSKEYKYNYFYGGGHEELFDLVNDKFETTNILLTENASKYTKIKTTLRKKLIDYEKEHWHEEYIENDDFVVKEPYPVKYYRNMARPQFPSKLNNEEQLQMNDFYDEVIQAVEREDIVKFHELDIATWQKNLNVPQEIIDKLIKISTKRGK